MQNSQSNLLHSEREHVLPAALAINTSGARVDRIGTEGLNGSGSSRLRTRGRAAVIGSGFGGLAAAIRLQSMGFETVCFEGRDQPGGRAYVYRDAGFTFVATLNGTGPFTVMAPTDAAFAKLPAGTVESLIKPENKAKLAAILTYHVVAGKVPAATVVTLKEAGTVEGSKITIEVKDGSVYLNGNTKVIITDVHCSNGIIHAIDTVLMPPSK